MWRGVMNARHATLWSVTHPSRETVSRIPQCITKCVRKENDRLRAIFFRAGKLVGEEKKWHGLSQHGATSISRASAAMTQPHKKPAGNNSKVNWNANNEKKWHKPGEGEGRRTKRSGGTRCPFDRSLHSLFLRAPRLREKDVGGEKERGREMTKEGLDCVPISHIYSAARTIRTRSTVFWTHQWRI